MAPHYHDEACVVFIASGAVEHTEGSRTALLTSRSTLYIPPGCRHADTFSPAGSHCVVARINPVWFRERQLDSVFDQTIARVTRDRCLYALGLVILRETEWPDDLSMLTADAALLELFVTWIRQERRITPSGPRWLTRVRAALHDSFRRRISLGELAAVADVHPAHLAREFRRAYGTTVGEYIRRLRVDFVAGRLGGPGAGRDLAALALEAGFSSHAHMTSTFRQVTSLTPSEYRRAHQRGVTRATDAPCVKAGGRPRQ